jgi:hypothetical protein
MGDAPMVARTTLEIEVDAVAARPAAGVFDLAESDEDPPKRGQEGWQDDDWLPAGSAQLGIP